MQMCPSSPRHAHAVRYLGKSEDLFQKSAHLIHFCSRVSFASASAVFSPGSLIYEYLSDSPIAASCLTSGVLGLQMHSSTSGSLHGN